MAHDLREKIMDAAAMQMTSTGFFGSDYGRVAPAGETIFTVNDFNAALSLLPWKQEDVTLGGRTDTCRESFELIEYAFARPQDVAQITGVVLRGMYDLILMNIDAVHMRRASPATGGVIAWKDRPEFECKPHSIVTEYRDDGPDRCAITDRRCVKDHDWVLVRVYARFSFAPTTP